MSSWTVLDFLRDSRRRQPKRQKHARRKITRALTFDSLDSRTLLSTIAWVGNKDGGDGSNWDNALNWEVQPAPAGVPPLHQVPGSSDAAQAYGSLPVTIGSQVVASVQSLNASAPLVINGSLSVANSASAVNIVTNNGTFVKTGGTIQGLLTNSGTANLNGVSVWARVTNSGTLSTGLLSTNPSTVIGTTMSGGLTNSGTANLTGSTVNGGITNSGKLDAFSDPAGKTNTTTISGGGTNSGALTEEAGATLDLYGGSLDVNKGSSISGSGMLIFSGNLAINIKVALNNDSSALVLDSSNLNGPQGFTNSSPQAMILHDGAINAAFDNLGTLLCVGTGYLASGSINGPFTAENGSTLRLQTGAPSNYSVGDVFGASLTIATGFTNHGLIDLTQAGTPNNSVFTTMNIMGGTLTNAVDGLITASAGSGGYERALNFFKGSSLVNQGKLQVAIETSINLEPDSTPGSTFINSGSVDVGGAQLSLSGMAQDIFSNSGNMTIHDKGKLLIANTALSNTGNIRIDSTSTFSTWHAALNNSGQVTVFGTLTVDTGYTQTLGTTMLVGGTLSAPGTGVVINGGILVGPGTIAGNVTVGGNSKSAGTVAPGDPANPLIVHGVYTQTAGTTALTGCTLTAYAVNILGGSLTGPGRINAPVTNGGEIAPSTPTTGTLTIGGTYSQTASGVLDIRLGGAVAPNLDQVISTGQATLGGTLNVSVVPGYSPAIGTHFSVVFSTRETGKFATINGLESGARGGLAPSYAPTFFSLVDVGFTPAQIRTAYGINGVAADGTGQTIAIVVAFDDPNIFKDVDLFDQQFGTGVTPHGPTLFAQYGAATSFLTVLNPTGQGTDPGDPSLGPPRPPYTWEGEEIMDVEWVHAIAPGAKIVMVEGQLANLFSAVDMARNYPNVSVVSMSWGSREFAAETGDDASVFSTPVGHTPVTFVAATGDHPAHSDYPAYSPHVLGVGGTSLTMNADHSYNSETAWAEGSGGVSAIEIEPPYQWRVQTTGKRTSPDVAFEADGATGVAVFNSYNPAYWDLGDGTSLGTACWAGMIALADQIRVSTGAAPLDGQGQTVPEIYALPDRDFHDVIAGGNGFDNAQPGYDKVTGLGSPVANLLIPDLADLVSTTNTALTSDARTTTYGTAINFTAKVTAYYQSTGAPQGTVTFIDWTTQNVLKTVALNAIGVGTFTTSDLSAGNHFIVATYSGDHNLYLASSGPLDETVNAAHVTITADDQVMTYGGALLSPTYTVTGLVNGETPLVFVASGNTPPHVTPAVPLNSHVGVFPAALVPSGASDPNYTITYVAGALTINPAPLTITALPQTKAYGEPVPTPHPYAIIGFVNGDTSTVVRGSPFLDTTASAASSVGTYPITVVTGSASAADYVFPTANLIASTLTVTPAQLRLMPDSFTRVYGQANPKFTYQIAGFANGDDSGVVTGEAAVNPGASITSDVGQYVITFAAGTLSALNYDFPAANFGIGTLTITPAPLTVTIDPKTKVYGQANPSLTGTVVGVLNGDDVTVNYSTTATMASGVSSIGYPITVRSLSGAKAIDYSVTVPGAQVTKSVLTITPAPLTAFAGDLSKVYGSANPNWTYGFSGFVNGDTSGVVSGTPSITTPARLSSPVGAYPIIIGAGSLSAANYSITSFEDGTLTVTPAALTITPRNETMNYGGILPPLPFDTSGWANGDTSATFSAAGNAPPTITTATATSHVGTYAVTASGAINPNYTIQYVNGILTIAPVPLTIIANNQTMTYGGKLAALTSSDLGLVNGDTSASLSRPPNVAPTLVTAPVTSHAGVYSIVPSGAVDPDYTIQYVAGTLSITQAPLTITADGKTRLYGQANPILTASYSVLVNGDTSASLTTAPSLSTTANITSAVGAYPIVVSGAVDPDYRISLANGTLSVLASPPPGLISISPNQIAAGYPYPLTLTLTGSSFLPQSVVNWNGAPLTTTYVSSTMLSATIPASDFASAGYAAIVLTNPAAAGGASAGTTFQVRPVVQTLSKNGVFYVLESSGQLEKFSSGVETVLDSNSVLSFALSPSGDTLYDLEGDAAGATNGGRLMQYTPLNGWRVLDTNDVLSFALDPLDPTGLTLYSLDGNTLGAPNGGRLMKYNFGSGWWAVVLDSNDVLSFSVNPSGTIVYDLEGNLPGNANGGRLVQYAVGVGWSLLDSNDVLSFAMNPSGTIVYDLEGNLPGNANGGRLVQYTVGAGWSLLDSNDVLSFAMNPAGTILYDLEGNLPGSSGRLVQYAVGSGWSLLDGNDVLSFTMSPNGTTLYALEGNPNSAMGRLVQDSIGIGWSLLDANDVLSFAMSPRGDTVFALEGTYAGDTRGGRLEKYTATSGLLTVDDNNVKSFTMNPSGATLCDLDGNGSLYWYTRGTWTLIDNNGTSSFAMAPSGGTLYDLETNGNLWQFTVGAGWTLLDNNAVLQFAMAPSGMTLYDLEGSGNRLERYNVGAGWTLLDNNGTSSFAMAPSGCMFYDLETNGNLWQNTAGVGWTLLDSNAIRQFAMAPSGMTLFDLEGNGNRLVQYTVGIGWSLLDGNRVQSFAMAPDGGTLYVLDASGFRQHAGFSSSWVLLDSANVTAFVPSALGSTLYVLDSRGLWQYTVGTANPWVLLDPNAISVWAAPGIFGCHTLYVRDANGVITQHPG